MEFDNSQRQCITDVIKVNISDDQCNLATLPVKDGGLGIRSVTVPASLPSWHLLQALRIQNNILPSRLYSQADSSRVRSVDAWKKLAVTEVSTEAKQRKQKKWDTNQEDCGRASEQYKWCIGSSKA